MTPTDTESLVTRPLDELAGCVWNGFPRGGSIRASASENLSAAVGAREAMVLLTVSDGASGSLVELHLTPADVLLLAARLVRMARAVHEAVNERSNPQP